MLGTGSVRSLRACVHAAVVPAIFVGVLVFKSIRNFFLSDRKQAGLVIDMRIVVSRNLI